MALAVNTNSGLAATYSGSRLKSELITTAESEYSELLSGGKG